VQVDALELRELALDLLAYPQGQARRVGLVEAGQVVEQVESSSLVRFSSPARSLRQAWSSS
jgi:hypothetical protein